MIEAERLAAAASLGVHGRRKAGMGETFWQFRRHRTEDPSSAVDWRQSAKSQHLFVREREWEAAQAVWLWCDLSASMAFGSGNIKKSERAKLLAMALASLLIRGGERVTLLGDPQAPKASRRQLRRIATALDLSREGSAIPPQGPIAANGLVIWISDFLSPLEEIRAALAAFAAAGVAGYLLRIADPVEEDFPFRGRIRFDAPEGPVSETIGRAERVRDAYRTRFFAHTDTVRTLAQQSDWFYLSHRTDQSPQTALVALYAQMSGEMAARR
ncbi:MAG: DUF58 domain-containing protein [Alphaproteobacteria bacterium]|nr:DUF58 domain-containing protein [Alphaproteobacteria bacterium]